MFAKVDEIVNRIGQYYDESDTMTDYFNTAFYKSYSVGKWDKDYICNNELPSFEAADQYCPSVQIEHGTKAGYVQLWFSDKPSADILAELKTAGYRWNNKASCWWGLESSLPGRYAEEWASTLEYKAETKKREEEHQQYLADQAIQNEEGDQKRLVIERASNEHKAANANKQIDNKFIPVNVFVQWSESGYFVENTLYTFAEFERIAKQAAQERGENNGYYKTKCNIIWSDGYEWANARIDLAIGDEVGATDHLNQYCDYYGNADNLTKTGIKDPQKQLDEITEFLKTHHLHVPNDTKTNVIDFNKAQTDKKQDQFFNSALDAVEVPNYKTDKLNNLLSVTRKIIYFSGDVETGQARNIRECDKEQLLRAASLQHFQIVDLHYIVRLVFDSDYIYDLYIDNDVSALLKSLDIEIDENYKTAEIARERLNNTINKLLH